MSDEWACDCTDEGPCEEHCEILAQRVGASNRSADELCVTYLYDALSIDPDVLSPYGRDVLRAADADLQASGPFTSWLEDPDLADELRDVVHQVESDLGLWTIWDDGYVILRLTGGPYFE